MNNVATRQSGEIMESVIIKGDLSKLTPQERSNYYVEVCRSVGLNPLTKPFEYITLNGKLTLYALRACTDQLRSIYEVSVDDLAEAERDGVFIVTAKVRNGKGRTDMAKGAVTVANLKGDALANAIMKAETKAKRRATLSICGLGFLDETEIETIPAAARQAPRPAPVSIVKPTEVRHDPQTGEIADDIPAELDRRPKKKPTPHALQVDAQAPNWVEFGHTYIAAIRSAETLDEANDWAEVNQPNLDLMKQDAPKTYARLVNAVAKHRAALVKPEDMVEAEDANIMAAG